MKTLSNLFLFTVTLFFFLDGYSQQQHMNWHFGSGIGLNFSTGNPVPFSGSMIETMESCYTVNDDNGNILFYTNGIDVWDADNVVMPNGSGLLGNNSSQCMVLPKPGNPDVYYIVASDATNSALLSGITYSEVNMSLNGGNGDVTATKNVTLNGNAAEWITAVPHANCVDTWILCHGYEPNSVMTAFLLSAAGIDHVPVESNLGYSVVPGVGIGLMKANPVTGQIVLARTYMGGQIDLLDFDNATGMVTLNETLLPAGVDMSYGVEFSRSGTKLYISAFMTNAIYQFDLAAADIPMSKTLVGNPQFMGEIGQLQIAPNDKIYMNYQLSNPGNVILAAINNPEVAGIGCNFDENAVIFPGSAIYGLPWYYNTSELMNQIPDLGNNLTACNENLVLDPFQSESASGTFLWSDGSTDSVLNVSVSGTYWVSYQIGSCEPGVDTVEVTIDTTEIVNPLTDTSGCEIFHLQSVLENASELQDMVWHIGNNDWITGENFDYTFQSNGNYTVYLTAETQNNCFIETDTAEITVFAIPTADFSFDPEMFNPGELISLTDESEGGVVSWQWNYENEVISNDNLANLTPEGYEDIAVTLVVQSSDGCSDTITKTIFMNTRDLLYVPNAFTPNGDGINDYFELVDLNGIVSELEIYNRWGELVWKADKINRSWDGKYRGEFASDGTYTWQIKTLIGEINREVITGHVTLNR